jgi:hypothetical protein
MPVSPDLIAEYWDYLDEMPAGQMDLDRPVIESVNGHLAARLRHILDVNGLQDRTDILLAVDASADFRAYSTPLASGYLIAQSVRFQLAAEAVSQALAATVPGRAGLSTSPGCPRGLWQEHRRLREGLRYLSRACPCDPEAFRPGPSRTRASHQPDQLDAGNGRRPARL